MGNNIFDELGSLILRLLLLCTIFVPLGMWKLIELIIQAYHKFV